eukprot:c16156_g1_i2.p1 GENE.c16156_g1_i2~~c16156_g1_i2.p1  ORF type:complete len:769 (+),score=175.70 c16156_g1_i2:40-2346(+)
MKVTNVKTLDSFFNRGESLRGKIETHSRHLTDTTAQAQLLGQSIKLRLNKKKFRYTRVSVFADRIELVIVAGVDNPEMVPVRSLDRMVQAKFTEVETKAQTITWRLSKLRTAIPNGSNLGVVMDPEKFKLHLIDPDGVLKTVPTTMTKDIYRSIAKFNTRLQQLNLLLNDPVALSAMIHMCYSSLASQVLVSKEDVTKYTVFDDEGIPDVGLPHNIASSLVGEARLAYNAIQSLTTRIKMISNDLPILLAKRTEIMQQVYEIQSKAYDLARSEAKMSMIDASLVAGYVKLNVRETEAIPKLLDALSNEHRRVQQAIIEAFNQQITPLNPPISAFGHPISVPSSGGFGATNDAALGTSYMTNMSVSFPNSLSMPNEHLDSDDHVFIPNAPQPVVHNNPFKAPSQALPEKFPPRPFHEEVAHDEEFTYAIRKRQDNVEILTGPYEWQILQLSLENNVLAVRGENQKPTIIHLSKDHTVRLHATEERPYMFSVYQGTLPSLTCAFRDQPQCQNWITDLRAVLGPDAVVSKVKPQPPKRRSPPPVDLESENASHVVIDHLPPKLPDLRREPSDESSIHEHHGHDTSSDDAAEHVRDAWIIPVIFWAITLALILVLADAQGKVFSDTQFFLESRNWRHHGVGGAVFSVGATLAVLLPLFWICYGCLSRPSRWIVVTSRVLLFASIAYSLALLGWAYRVGVVIVQFFGLVWQGIQSIFTGDIPQVAHYTIVGLAAITIILSVVLAIAFHRTLRAQSARNFVRLDDNKLPDFEAL